MCYACLNSVNLFVKEKHRLQKEKIEIGNVLDRVVEKTSELASELQSSLSQVQEYRKRIVKLETAMEKVCAVAHVQSI